MKYLLLAYTKRANWETVDVTSPEFQAMCAFYDDLTRELTGSGELLATEGLTHPNLASTVRKQEGGSVATDGPYAESKEILASFAIVECATRDRAMAVAARIVDITGDTVEVRPVADDASTDA